MEDNRKEFKEYNNWCKEHNLKPGHATSLELYFKEKKEER